MKNKIWLLEPEEHDFPAAADYLDLLYNETLVKDIIERLRSSPTIRKKAKDILRASQLSLLRKNNIHVKEDLQKVKRGQKLSPILLVRDNGKLIIADGYHRACSIYYLSEDLEIPCRITEVKESK